jgi:hypothetical protein
LIQSAKPAADAGTYLDNKLFEWYGTNNVSKADAIKDLWKHAALYPVQSTVSDWDNVSFCKKWQSNSDQGADNLERHR